jgi:hypothetical protein
MFKITVMRAGVRPSEPCMPLFAPAHTGPMGLFILCVSPTGPAYLKKISLHRSRPSRAPASCAHRCRIPHRAPHLAPRDSPIQCRAPSRTAPHPSPRHRCCAPSPVRVEVLLGCCQGATDAVVPHQKVMAAAMRDLSKEML